jgi:serine phosphatase RsbU (regulator of sigma subunit)
MALGHKDSQIIMLDQAAAVTLLPTATPPEWSAPGSSEQSSSRIIPLSEELRSAGRIQRSLLPREFPRLTGWQVAGSCVAAGPIGGDFYDIQKLPGDRTLFLVADVMGKGIPAALIASVLRAVVRNVALQAESPAEILSRVNELIYEDLSNAEMFVTMQAACLNLPENTVEVASAGHCPLLFRTSNGQVNEASPQGIPIGVAPRASYGLETIDAADLEIAIMHTDGITEARNSEGQPFGLERLANWIQGAAKSSAELLKEQLSTVLETFQSGVKARDDQTVLVFTRSR